MCKFSLGIYLKADLQETNKDDWGVGTWVVSIDIEISGDEIISMFIVILGTYQSILYLCITPKVILLLDRSETLHVAIPAIHFNQGFLINWVFLETKERYLALPKIHFLI